jgi:choline monooxygenase
MHRFFVDPDIAVARTLDTSFYTDQEIYRSIKQKIFSTSWQYITDESNIKERGACLPFILMENFLDEPLLITRDNDDHLHCLSNVCTHRGNIIVNEKCNSNHLRCRYHGRIFSLNGHFTSMPEFREVKDFPSEMDDLHLFAMHR